VYHTLHNVYTDQMTLVLYASNIRVNADTPRAYKISFSRLLPQMAWLMPDAHASTKMCFKGDYKWDFSLHFLFLHHVDNSHIQCKTVKCRSLEYNLQWDFCVEHTERDERYITHEHTWIYRCICTNLTHTSHTYTKHSYVHAHTNTHKHT
jgi:hypothetical protein